MVDELDFQRLKKRVEALEAESLSHAQSLSRLSLAGADLTQGTIELANLCREHFLRLAEEGR